MQARKLAFEILIGLAASYFVVFFFFSGDRRFEDLALGTETSTYNALDSVGNAIHIQHTDREEGLALVETWKKHGSKPVVLILGNSQTHSINQVKSGEVNYVELLHRTNKQHLYDILSISLPNASMQEFYLLFEYWRNILPIHTLIIPVFMDDFREDGIRDVYFKSLIESRFQIPDSTSSLSKKINKELRAFWVRQQIPTASSTVSEIVADSTFQDRSENYLNKVLEKKSLAWANRPNVRGEFFNWLYKIRNTVLGINASTVRRMIPQRWANNMQALQQLSTGCILNATKMIIYIPPIRSDAKLPYDKKEYEDFKITVKQVADDKPEWIHFKNYEKIVPNELWGYKAATNLKADREVDYMHFQYSGHKIMKDSLQVLLTEVLAHGI